MLQLSTRQPHLLGSCEDDCAVSGARHKCGYAVTRHTLLVRIYCRAVCSGNAGGMWTCMPALRRVYVDRADVYYRGCGVAGRGANGTVRVSVWAGRHHVMECDAHSFCC